MSVPELLKSALPLNSVQCDGGNVGVASPAKNFARSQQILSIGTPGGGNSVGPNNDVVGRGKMPPKPPEEFYKDLQQFHERRGTPVMHMPKISGRVIDLHRLYSEVTERGGFLKVNMRDEWEEVLPQLHIRDKCVNATAAIKHIYRRFLEKYERLNYFGEDPDKMEAMEAMDAAEMSGRSRPRYPSTMYSSMGGGSAVLNAVPMSYNYRQHVVNMDRRRNHKLSTDLHKPSPYEKLMLSLMSPLPNEQDFAINACTLMANESKHTLKLNEFPKLLDVLLAHAGVFPDCSMRLLFQHVYTEVRHHSLLGFWRDLLHDKPQILQLYTEEPAMTESDEKHSDDDLVVLDKSSTPLVDECLSMDFLNLGRGEGTQDYVGQRVQQIISILRNLSFFDENQHVFAKNRTFLRFIVMSANIRWGNVHNQALDIAGNVAAELDLLDPTTDELSRNLVATLCEGIEGMDRAVIINSLEILYKLCQKDSNEEHIQKCLNLEFYQTLCLFLSLNDIMLLIFTLEAIYALSSMGARSCHQLMQVRGIIDQLVSLITVEAQSYGPDGCILMRVVETVPGNMLPIVAQNIANLQNVAVIQKQQHQVVQHTVSMPQPQQLQLSQADQQQLCGTVAATANETTATQPAPQPQPQTQPAPPQPLQMPTNYTHEDEQYALAWLGATFERAASVDSRVEQQELYRMYLSHCQKSGKHSVVNHLQFPRLVRLIFSNGVGPLIVRRPDGTELPGFHYVAIRVRAQPLPIQSKSSSSQTTPKTIDGKLIKSELASVRKTKKKLKLQVELPLVPQQQQQQQQQLLETNTEVAVEQPKEVNTTVAAEVSNESVKVEITSTTGNITQAVATSTEQQNSNISADVKMQPVKEEQPKSTTPVQQQQVTTVTLTEQQQQQQPSSSLIKSLLANKVNQRQQKQKELTAATTMHTTTQTNVVTTTTICSSSPSQQQPPIKVTSNAISALVNNSLMQTTPVKVGQTTIKPLNAQSALDKKQIIDSAPPPLAPLSGSNVAKDANGRPVIIANQMLVEILDKKTVDPPLPGAIVKRKIEDTSNLGTESAKRLALDAVAVNNTDTPPPQITPSKNAANLYAEMAASILEDEDLEDLPSLLVTEQQSLILPAAKIQQQQPPPPSLQNVQRQLVFQTNQQPPQLKLTQTNSQQIPTAMATIKTEQGLQTVPVILQQKPMDQVQPQLLQQVIQQQNAPQQTQYVLATNQQGQTYLVAQQQQPTPTPQPPPPQQTQTVLVTQTPQQQSAGTKTIIILQQQTQPQQQQIITTTGPCGTQKMIMTTPQGQQVLVTQRPTQQHQMTGGQVPQQFFINAQTGTATATAGFVQRQIIQSPALAPPQQHQQQLQTQTGQISPSLLSQLNHIPATIKLHQPQPLPTMLQQQQQQQPATISRVGKPMSIVQQNTQQTAPIQIPQLQQHQSIIQQHIISGPAADKQRQVLLSGGRAIEIKETVITQTQLQTQPAPQQSQLNSQTIITTQPQPQQQQQQLQQIRAAIEQQQQHPSIIQQKITVPIQAAATVATTLPPKPVQPTVTQSTLKKHSTQPQPSAGPPPLTTASTVPTQTTAAATNILQQQQQQQQQEIKTASKTTEETNNTPSAAAIVSSTVNTPSPQQPLQPPLTNADATWLYVCDWRNCPRRKFKSVSDLQHHACQAHSPDHLEAGAEIFCQWGPGPNLCDGIPRKRYSLMTHIIDRHLTPDALRATMQRRLATGAHQIAPAQPPVTIVRNIDQAQRSSTASPALSTSSSSSLPSTGSSALHAIKRHTADFINPKELMDENEGPVTKSIRLTAALILRNLVTYTSNAKRSLRRYEPHLSNVALSNVESSAAISHILYELNN